MPEETAQARSLAMDVDKVLSTLATREGDILRARYGLDDGKLKTLEEVGLLFSVRNNVTLCLSDAPTA